VSHGPASGQDFCHRTHFKPGEHGARCVKSEFDPVADQGQVVSLLRDRCTHLRKIFEIQDMNLNDLLATAMEDPELIAGGNAAFRGIKFADLQTRTASFARTTLFPNGTSMRAP
jgi:hypothetical protein